MVALNVQATPVTEAHVVRRAVSAWAAENGNAFDRPGSVTGVQAEKDSDGTILYWVASMSNGGAVIVSPDTDLDLVVAVVEKFDGTFPKGHPLPSILRADMKNRLSVIRGASASAGSSSSGTSGVRAFSTLSLSGGAASAGSLPEDVKASVKKANAQWTRYRSSSGGVSLLGATLEGGDGSPYVRRIVDGFESGGRYTHWNQSDVDKKPCYNYYTPNNEVCGCVATAGAAILQFFGCTGTEAGIEGEGCSLYSRPYEAVTIGGELDWSILPKAYGGQSESDELDEAGRELLGRAAYDMGVLVNMNWASSGPDSESGALLLDLVAAFKAFGFNTSRCVTFRNAEANQYQKTIYAQNWCGAPVVLGIRSAFGGHAVIACGYACDGDGDSFCRVFMGWGGYGDAWYKLPEIESFSLVDEAITMIGYADDAVVPVYGTANVPGIDLTIPGWKDDAGDAVTVKVNGSGSFGIRVPMSLAESARKIAYEPKNILLDITPFDATVIQDVEAGRAALDRALPDEMLFSVLNMTLASTVEAARAIALRDNKALLMVSGNVNTERTAALLESLYHLDDTTDISNKFVFVYTSVTSASMNGVDGDPSIGVFDPAVGSADLRWWIANGRLAYDNFIEGVDEETDEIIYTLDGMDTDEIVSMLSNSSATGILDVGYDAFLRRRSDAVVTVTGVGIDFGIDDPFEVAAVEPAYGEIAKAWTNCESVVFSAPAVYTNEAKGVVYSCVGWSTNEVFDADGYATYNPGNTVTIDLEAGTEMVFTWVWKISRLRVTASTEGLPPVQGLICVTPSETWCELGSRVTLMATNAVGWYALSGWEIQRSASSNVESGDYVNIYDAYQCENGNTLSFFVYEPLNVCAKYRQVKYEEGKPAPSSAPDYRTYAFRIESSPAEVSANVSLQSGLQWGDNAIPDSIVHLAPQSPLYVDSANGVWICKGWMVDGELVDSPDVAYMLDPTDQGCVFTSVWELQTPEVVPDGGDAGGSDGSDDDDPVEPDQGPEPAPIAFSSISRDDSGVYTISLTNGVKGCWYHLEYTDSLSPALWQPAELQDGFNPQQALEDGVVTFRAVGNPNPGGRFWRAKATKKETGD